MNHDENAEKSKVALIKVHSPELSEGRLQTL
jgi:hypothetical protein